MLGKLRVVSCGFVLLMGRLGSQGLLGLHHGIDLLSLLE